MKGKLQTRRSALIFVSIHICTKALKVKPLLDICVLLKHSIGGGIIPLLEISGSPHVQRIMISSGFVISLDHARTPQYDGQGADQGDVDSFVWVVVLRSGPTHFQSVFACDDLPADGRSPKDVRFRLGMPDVLWIPVAGCHSAIQSKSAHLAKSGPRLWVAWRGTPINWSTGCHQSQAYNLRIARFDLQPVV